MNPYEKTTEELKRQSQAPKGFAKTAATIGATVASFHPALRTAARAFVPILSRAAPFLSEYIPEELSVKGLSKVDPNLGKFVKTAMDKGFDFQQVKDFIGDQINQSKQEHVKDSRNIIEQYSPELHQFIDQEMKKGQSGIQAGAKAQATGKFSKIIDKITKDHKIDWLAMLKNIYGDGEGSQGIQKSKTYNYRESNQPNETPMQQQAGQGVDPGLMQLIQEGNTLLNNLRGQRG